jgi:uncharacterized protein YecE (DUF72 family)
MAPMGDLCIGTAGWSYPSPPGAWTGIVYPARQGKTWRGTRFDELAWYAERFDTVEVNTSFYRVPSVDMTRKWAARTPAGFAFSVKLFQKLTHPAMFLDRLTKSPDAKTRAEETGATEPVRFSGSHNVARLAAQVSQDDVDAFKAAIDPLASAGKLGALLAQFPASFKADAPSRDYLAWLLETFRDHRVAVELRHRSWSDRLGDTLEILNASKAAFVQIDEPKFRTSIAQNFLPNVTGFYYLRLHGRNAKAWWKHDHPAERYNYLYSKEELDPFVEIAEAVRTLVKKMYLYTNNHFEGKAVANALMMKQSLGLPIEGAYPPGFVERYPALAGVVSTIDASHRASTPTSKASPSLF